jgi:hypothetical protein
MISANELILCVAFWTAIGLSFGIAIGFKWGARAGRDRALQHVREWRESGRQDV